MKKFLFLVVAFFFFGFAFLTSSALAEEIESAQPDPEFSDPGAIEASSPEAGEGEATEEEVLPPEKEVEAPPAVEDAPSSPPKKTLKRVKMVTPRTTTSSRSTRAVSSWGTIDFSFAVGYILAGVVYHGPGTDQDQWMDLEARGGVSLGTGVFRPHLEIFVAGSVPVHDSYKRQGYNLDGTFRIGLAPGLEVGSKPSFFWGGGIKWTVLIGYGMTIPDYGVSIFVFGTELAPYFRIGPVEIILGAEIVGQIGANQGRATGDQNDEVQEGPGTFFVLKAGLGISF